MECPSMPSPPGGLVVVRLEPCVFYFLLALFEVLLIWHSGTRCFPGWLKKTRWSCDHAFWYPLGNSCSCPSRISVHLWTSKSFLSLPMGRVLFFVEVMGSMSMPSANIADSSLWFVSCLLDYDNERPNISFPKNQRIVSSIYPYSCSFDFSF